jgi:hypothetical protein
MMNTPSMYSVDQLLKARQNGVPDYVVVPMLQKAMAQKQAMAQQQALQQGAPKPPVAQQILDAAHNDVIQEHMARRAEEAPEPRGIDSLPSGIDESDYAHGGIIAFAEGGDINGYPAFDESAYADPYAPNEIDPVALREQYKSMVGTDPNIAKQEERIKAREEGLKSEEDKAPWLALMHAGLATMAGTSPNALANIGAGATKGLEYYGESKKNLSARADKLDDLRGKIEESQRAEALAAANYGMNSAEHRKQANVTAKLKGAEAKESHIKNAMGYGIEKEKVAVDREGHQVSAGNAAASLAESKRYHDALLSGKGEKPMTANQQKLYNYNQFKVAKAELTSALDDGDPALIAGAKEAYNDAYEAYMGKPAPKAGEKPPEEPGVMAGIKNFFSGPTPQPTPQTPNSGFSIRPRQ